MKASISRGDRFEHVMFLGSLSTTTPGCSHQRHSHDDCVDLAAMETEKMTTAVTVEISSLPQPMWL